jgi:hypothetical protein
MIHSPTLRAAAPAHDDASRPTTKMKAMDVRKPRP